MDEQLIRKLVRQLRWLNITVSFFGILFLVGFALAGFALYKAYGELHKAQDSISNIQQKASGSLNVQNDLCSSTSISPVLKRESGLCN